METLRGTRSGKDLRATPKNYGNRKVVGVIRDGKYVNPHTNEPIVIQKNKKIKNQKIRINRIGGVE